MKGRHLLFRHPGGHVPSGVDRLGPGIDVKADGGYIIAPPSLHASGRCYEWDVGFHPDEVEVADLPGWLVERLRRTSLPHAVHEVDNQHDVG